MDVKSNREYPFITDTIPANKFRLASSLLPYFSPISAFSLGLLSSTITKMPIPGSPDDVLFGGFLDAMKSSSPTHKNLNKDLIIDPDSEEANSAYRIWTLKCPSALSSFEQIANHARGKDIALFLDYDGTLSPIVSEPDCAFMSNKMRAAVKSVAQYFPTAIISGRSREKVFDFIGLKEVYYAGSHGMDIMGPVRDSMTVNNHPNCIRTIDKQGKELHLFQPASNFLPTINEVFRSLGENAKGIKGVKVENNKFCVSIHYRDVEEKNWPLAFRIALDVLKDHPNLHMTRGRKVLEIRPVIDWNKGNAVEFLLDSFGLGKSEGVFPIYIGDDQTDEDAFKVLREKNLGYGILVSSVPKESNAFYSLRDPSEVLIFLKSLVRWKKSAQVG